MNHHVLVTRTETLDVYVVMIADMDDKRYAGEPEKILGRYSPDIANSIAIEAGKLRNLPVIVAPS